MFRASVFKADRKTRKTSRWPKMTCSHPTPTTPHAVYGVAVLYAHTIGLVSRMLFRQFWMMAPELLLCGVGTGITIAGESKSIGWLSVSILQGLEGHAILLNTMNTLMTILFLSGVRIGPVQNCTTCVSKQ